MADQQPKELSMELRLLLALVLMLAVLFGTPYFFKSVNPPAVEKKPVAAPPAAVTKPPEETVKAETPKAGAPAASVTPPVAAQAEETLTLETDVYRIAFSNRGAVVRSWQLKKYTDAQKKPQELVNTVGALKTGYPFTLTFKNQKPSVDVNAQLFAVTRTPDGLGVDFDFSNGLVTAHKAFRFKKNTYLADITTEVRESNVALPHRITWRAGFGDFAVTNPQVTQHNVFYDLTAQKLKTEEAKAAKDGPVTQSGAFSFAGINDTYFACVFLPHANGAVELETFSDTVATPISQEDAPYAGAAVGGEGRNQFSLFVGPKDLDILRSINPRLEQVVDFGTWFGFLAKPLFLIVHWVNDRFINSWGWSIIVVTIFINIALFPLRLSSLKSTRKMQLLQPQINAINDRYKGTKMNDPKRQQQQQEVMALYQKHGVNPLASGCLPMLLQMPFLIAFYTVFTIAIEMRQASWLWVTDLSQHETLPIRILPIVMVVTQVILQKMTPATSQDPMQQKMMLFMPIVFGVMFYGQSSGLMLYWLTGNLIAILQQWFFQKTAVADAGPSAAPVTKKDGRK